LVTGGVQDEDLVNDGWTSIMQKLGVILADPSNSEDYADLTPEELGEAVELADFEKMEEIRARAASIVNDPEVAEKLKPYYRQFCKRPCFHDDYLPSFNKPNVHLIDTDGKGVSNITAQGVVFDGREYPVDCIIFATGFEIGTDYSRRAECAITGKGGATLEEKWAKGVRTLHGFQTNGFPNLFFMGLIQGGLTANNTHMLTEQSEHIAYLINRAKNGNYRSLEVSGEAEDDWVGVMKETALANEDFLAACTPGYYNDEGKKEINGVFGLQYGGGPDEFFRLLEAWRMDDRCEGVTYS
jgi:cyclohexanone monooxygenase